MAKVLTFGLKILYNSKNERKEEKMLKRAYTILQVKSFDETSEERIIKGIATTPAVDRVGDEVDPMGALFKTPMPLLLHHDHEKPVGTVEFAKAGKDGIPFIARIAKIEEDGKLKERTDEAWQSVKAGLIQAVSIGFSALDYVKTKTGLKFTKWEWHELSLVTVPANSEATITAIKSLDQKYLQKNVGDSTANKQTKTIKLNLKGTNKMKKYAEQIAQIKAQIKSNLEAMEALTEKSIEDGEALNDEQQAEFDSLNQENDTLEVQVKNFEILQAKSLDNAVEVKGKSSKEATASRTPGQKAAERNSSIKLNLRQEQRGGDVQLKEEKGIQFARVAKCIALAKGNYHQASDIAESMYGDNEPVIQTVKMLSKAVVPVANNATEAYAGALVNDGVVADFLAYQEPLSIIGQLNLKEVPFGNEWVEDLDGGEAYWVGEGNRKPATSFSLRRDGLNRYKLAALAVLTMENVQDSSIKSDIWVRDSLARAVNRKLDQSFIDPTNAGVANVSPASVTYGVTPTASTGTAKGDIKAAIKAYMSQNNGSRSGAKIIVDSESFFDLSSSENAVTGQLDFPTLATSGTIYGIPVIVSDYLSGFADTAGKILVVLNENAIVRGYSPAAPDLIVKWSDQASVVIDSDPEATTAPRSLWQENLVGCIVERRIDWKKARSSTAVVVVNGITW